jgi:enoyl-CoA hydratase/carnithine racemase/predicted thioesterase
MRPGLVVGSQAELHWQVTAEHVIHLGYPPPTVGKDWLSTGKPIPDHSVPVFSTPNMILMMERAARRAIEPFLEVGEESVGAAVNIEHLAGTPLGSHVRAVAKVTQIEKRLIDFEITAYDAHEMIGRGTHRRAVVLLEKIAAKMSAKQTAPHQPMTALPTSTSSIGNSMSLPQLNTLQLHQHKSILKVLLNRSLKLNAVNQQMTADWETLNSYLAANPAIRIVIVTGAGDAFCAGDDVKEVGTLDRSIAEQLSYRQARMYLAWEQLPQIFIAAINGLAYGAGCVLAGACDLKIAAHSAQFGMPEILLGWPPGYGIAQLTALVGKTRAIEMCLTGQPINAQKALDYGLVHRLVPKAQVVVAAEKWGEELLKLSAQALRETKKLVHADEGLQPKSAFLADTAAYIRCLELPDAKEGIAAFTEKRSPKFQG